MASETQTDTNLNTHEKQQLHKIKSADSLEELQRVLNSDSIHNAYFEAKETWYNLREKELDNKPQTGLPGDQVQIDGHSFWVHGVTHSGESTEKEYVHNHVSRFVEEGVTVYCEQGIRPMYFPDLNAACEMDDYRWALETSEKLNLDTDSSNPEFTGITENVDSLTQKAQNLVFQIIDSGSGIYGDTAKQVLGDIASEYLISHENMATGYCFEAYTKTREAARNPEKLHELQNYYKKAFLPQPLEREWLRMHDPELELMTHARNERMADYAVYHNESSSEVHLVVGAAHQPGVVYYLNQYREGNKHINDFELAE